MSVFFLVDFPRLSLPDHPRCWDSPVAVRRWGRSRAPGQPALIPMTVAAPPSGCQWPGGAVVVVFGPGGVALFCSTPSPGSHRPDQPAPWTRRGTSTGSGRPAAPRCRRAAAAATRRGPRAPPAPPACSWWGPTSAWARRSAVATLASWSLVSLPIVPRTREWRWAVLTWDEGVLDFQKTRKRLKTISAMKQQSYQPGPS